MNNNIHNLSRNIPFNVKRQIRIRDGFGCIVCGCSIIQYEHLNPPFKEAKAHVAEGIVLLCGGCHDKKTRGFLSIQTVTDAANNPRCKQKGFSHHTLDVASETSPSIIIGNNEFKSTKILLRVLGKNILSSKRPKSKGDPYLIDAHRKGSGL